MDVVVLEREARCGGIVVSMVFKLPWTRRPSVAPVPKAPTTPAGGGGMVGESAVAAADARALTTQESADFMTWWVDSMDARLAHFRDFVVGDKASLDFSEAGLTSLAELVLARYPAGSAPDWAGDKDFLEGVVRYLGETHRRRYGGQWSVGTDPASIAFTEAVVQFAGPVPALIPRIEVTSLVIRRDPHDWALVLRGGEAWLDEARTERVARGQPAEDPAWNSAKESETHDAEAMSRPSPASTEAPDHLDGPKYLRWWLASMTDALEQFMAAVPAETRSSLNGSGTSVRALGEMLLEQFESEAQFLSALRGGEPLAEGAVRYLGQLAVNHRDARWIYHAGPADDPNINRGRPNVISDGSDFSVNPEDLLGLTIGERDLRYLDHLTARLTRAKRRP